MSREHTSRRRRVRVKRPASRWVIGVGIIVFIFVVGLGFQTYLLQNDLSSLWFPADNPRAQAKPSKAGNVRLGAGESGNLTIDNLGQSFVGHNGGKVAFAALRSARFIGNLSVNEQVYPLEILKLAPDLVRIQLTTPRGQLSIGSDGQDFWQSFQENSGRVRTWALDQPAKDWLLLQAPLGTWLAQRSSRGIVLTIGESQPDAAGAPERLPVTLRTSAGREIEYLLDAATLRPKQLLWRSAPAGAPLAEAKFTDSETLNGISIPRTTVMQQPGGQVVTLNIQKIIPNVGVFGSFFTRPSEEEAPPEPPPARSSARSARSASVPGSLPSGAPPQLRVSGGNIALRSLPNSMIKPATPPARRDGAPPAAPKVEPAQRPVLEDYGFPWSLPW